MKASARLILTVDEAQKDHDRWLALRNKGLGGSDAGVVMGMNPYKGRLSLWMEKVGQKEPDDLSDNERVYWGIKNEANIADWFAEKTGKKVRKCGMMQSTTYPWLLANVDRLIVGEEAGLEIKTAGVNQRWQWVGDEIPDCYYAQCQHYMLVTGFEKWYIAVLIGGNEAIYKEVPRNESFISELLKREAAFWTMVENETMPEMDGSKDTDKTLSAMYPGAAEDSTLILPNTGDVVKIIEDRAHYAKAIADLEVFRDECDNKLKALMGNNEILIVGDTKVATWKNVAGRTSLDTKRLEKEMPDVYQKYVKVGKPTRRFAMVGEKKNG